MDSQTAGLEGTIAVVCSDPPVTQADLPWPAPHHPQRCLCRLICSAATSSGERRGQEAPGELPGSLNTTHCC